MIFVRFSLDFSPNQKFFKIVFFPLGFHLACAMEKKTLNKSLMKMKIYFISV